MSHKIKKPGRPPKLRKAPEQDPLNAAGVMEYFMAKGHEERPLPDLARVDSRHLANHYNGCLTEMGIQPTRLRNFRIDGIGWSPEVAAEKDDPDYLSHGLANPMAIVISPDQEGKAICLPFHSFNEDLMRHFFERYRSEIADITLNRGISIDLDQELMRYESPRDLQLVDYLIVRAHTGRITELALEQSALVDRLMNEDMAWFDARLREQIVTHAKTNGDLRFRQLHMPDMKYDSFQSYYTRALGGLFVLRHPSGKEDLLVTCSLAFAGKKADAIHIDDPALLDRLVEGGWAQLHVEWCANNMPYLKQKHSAMAVHAIAEHRPDIPYGGLASTREKQLLVEAGSIVPEYFHELERLIKRLEVFEGFPDVATETPSLYRQMLHPEQGLSLAEQQVVWRLLARFQAPDPCALYRNDRTQFFAQYLSWPAAVQVWTTQHINANPSAAK